MTTAPRRSSRSSRPPLGEVHRRLLRRFGPLGWWPAATPLEVCVGAILVQNAAWGNVEKALANLRAAGVLDDARAMRALPETRLAALVRPAGFFRVKAKRLRALLDWILERGGGDPVAALAGEPRAVRTSLLAVHGVGPETADSLLLYVAGLPFLPVDAYLRRVLGRHGWADPRAPYEDLRSLAEGSLPRDPALWNQFHAEIVETGKVHCRPRPLCSGCPLEPMLRGAPITR